jgi:toxin ParE1/3/4
VKTKPVIPRELAARDVDEALDYYLIEAPGPAGLGFVYALESAYAHIGRHPGAGSPRYAHALNLPGQRFLPLAQYPYLVFYLERENHIDVWRVLHGKRDIPAWLHEDENPA